MSQAPRSPQQLNVRTQRRGKRRMSALDYKQASQQARAVMGGNVPLLRAPIVEDLFELSRSHSQKHGSIAATMAAETAEESAEVAHRESMMSIASEAVETALLGHELYVESLFMGMDGLAPRRQRCRKLVMGRTWHAAVVLAICVHLALVLVEPMWAEDRQPDFSSWTWSVPALVGIEMMLLLVYALEMVTRVSVMRWQIFKTRRYYLVFMGAVVVLALDLAAYAAHGEYKWRVARCVRPILLVTRVRGLRRPLWVMVRTMLAVTQIGLFGSTIVLFYSVLGMQLFNTAQVPGYGPNPDGPILPHDPSRLNDVNGNFDNILEALLSTYTATTTESYPGVLYPALQLRPVVATLYFVSFMSVAIYIIMPLIIAVVYDMYRHVHKQQVARRRNAEHAALHFAYHVLIPNPDQAVMGHALFDELLGRVNTRFSVDQRTAIFKTLAGLDGDEGISLSEFLGLAYVLRFNWGMYQASHAAAGGALTRRSLHVVASSPEGALQSAAGAGRLGGGASESPRGSTDTSTISPLLAATPSSLRAPSRSRVGTSAASASASASVDASLIPPGILLFCHPCCWKRGARKCPSCCEYLWVAHHALSCRFGNRRTIGARISAQVVGARWFQFLCRAAVWGNVVTACLWTVGWQAQFNACDVAHRPTPTWQACWDEPIYIVQTLTVVFSTLGAIEMAVKLFGFGLPRFVSNWWNGADLFIVIVTAASSYVMWLNAREYLTDTTNAGISDILELGRALRVMRVITLEPKFRAVFESIVDCFSACVVVSPGGALHRILSPRRYHYLLALHPHPHSRMHRARPPPPRARRPASAPCLLSSLFFFPACPPQPPAFLRANVVRRVCFRNCRHDALRRRARGDDQRS